MLTDNCRVETGHCAVGSIVGINNAKIASFIGADMVLVANGGLGSAFDELELNRILCQHYNVRIAGVIINKVRPDKYEQTKHYMRKVCSCIVRETFRKTRHVFSHGISHEYTRRQ